MLLTLHIVPLPPVLPPHRHNHNLNRVLVWAALALSLLAVFHSVSLSRLLGFIHHLRMWSEA